jgi:hypothetical protein
LKPPGFNPRAYEVKNWFLKVFASQIRNLYRLRNGQLYFATDAVGLYKLNSAYLELESAWFQPLSLIK